MGDVINLCNRVANFFQPLMPNPSHFTTKRLKKCQNAKNIAQVKHLSFGYMVHDRHTPYYPTNFLNSRKFQASNKKFLGIPIGNFWDDGFP